MALATKCPHCNTVFRVAADQLKLRGGIVRCGACNEVFDGNAALVEPAARPTPHIPEVVISAAAAAPAAALADGYIHGAPVDFDLDEPTPEDPAAADAALPAEDRLRADEPLPTTHLAPAEGHVPAEESQAPVEDLAPAERFAPVDDPAPAAHLAPAAEPAPAAHLASAEAPPPAEDQSRAADIALPADAPPAEDPAPAAAASSEHLAADINAGDDAEAEAQAQTSASETTATSAPAPAAPAVWRTASAPHLADRSPAEPLAPVADAQAADKNENEPAAAPATAPEPEPAPEPTPESAAADQHGRLEPNFDTPQEHIVAAALDDLHHFEDLATTEPPSAQELHAAALEELHRLGDSRFDAASEPGPVADAAASRPARDETAVHAIAAVNTDARDDGESIPADDSNTDNDSNAAPTAAPVSHLAPDPKGDGELDHAELGFVRRANRSEKYGRSAQLAMLLGVPLLLLALALQAATTFRDTLAANYPALKPTLETTCAVLGCKIGLPTQLDALSIEQGELQTVADNTFSFTTTLRNQSRATQAWPHIELILNDSADKPVLRRVFAPRDYLPPADAAKGFTARSEQTVKLYFELSQLKASGYHIAIFYP